MLLVGHGYLFNYYAGLDDIPLLMQAAYQGPHEWFSLGYHDWMDTRPDIQTPSMYEIRPLTHAYSWLAWELTDGDIRWNPLFMVAGGAGATAAFIALSRTVRLSTFQAALALLLFWLANPARPDGIFMHLAFLQVSLALIVFCLIPVAVAAGRYWPLLFMLIASALIKESTFYFGVMAGAMWLLHYPTQRGRAAAIVAGHAAIFIGLRFAFHADGLPHIISSVDTESSWVDNLGHLIASGIMSSARLPFLVGLDAGTITPWMALPLSIISIALLVGLSRLAAQSASHGQLLVVAGGFSLGSFYLFNDSLRWGWEFSSIFSICLALLMTHRPARTGVFAFLVCSLWLFTGVSQTVKTAFAGHYDFGGKLDRLVYGEYIRALQYAAHEGVSRLYVINDPTYINSRYLNEFAGTDVDVRVVSELFLDYFFEHGDQASTLTILQEGDITRVVLLIKEGALIEERHTLVDRKWPTPAPGGNHGVSTQSGVTTSITESSLNHGDGILIYDPKHLSYLLYIQGRESWSVFTRYPRSAYLNEALLSVPCSDISSVLINNQGGSSLALKAAEFFSPDTGNNMTSTETGCRVRLGRQERTRSRHAIVFMNQSGHAIEMMSAPVHPYPVVR